MSAGNDIVFLPASRPERTTHPRFYPRIITPAEQQLLPALDLPFDQGVWLCWSIKESAYKYHRRHSTGLQFAPLKITVNEFSCNGDFYFSTVSTGSGPLHARSLVRDGIIVSIVSSDENFRDTHWGFRQIGSPAYRVQSPAVRAFALQELKTVLRRDDLRIEKDAEGCPRVLAEDPGLSVPVSLAHHDRYVAWSFTYSASSLRSKRSVAV